MSFPMSVFHSDSSKFLLLGALCLVGAADRPPKSVRFSVHRQPLNVGPNRPLHYKYPKWRKEFKFGSKISPRSGSGTLQSFNSSTNENRAQALGKLRDRAALQSLEMSQTKSKDLALINSSSTNSVVSNPNAEAGLLVASSALIFEAIQFSGTALNAEAGLLVASSALIFEAIQFSGTALVAYLIHKAIPEAKTLEDAIMLLTGAIRDLGPTGYLAYAGIQVFFQVFPIASAFAMTVSAGVVFGSLKNGVAIVSLASTFSAMVSFIISRSVYEANSQNSGIKEFKEKSSQLRAIDTALADAGFFNSVLLMFLLRSSPIIPFSWANYLFGLSRVPLVPFVLGTFLGTLPGITAMVSAGILGGEVLTGGNNGFAFQAGIVATVLSFILIGRISDAKLKEMNIELQEE
eukprot:CAMPEP_0114537424 /NCGR_PEP_ID=MMETSP0109-20121206/29573_1 /TAXON_ID=29199 /ORGANISM="Chlorarachnion reptans, Strain CCCM449" /LENGTH=404 /DNA_ID=CAMNT_0001721317 /DNA_START=185 /DNA_END=1398 /DNA_ORIENTATION=-